MASPRPGDKPVEEDRKLFVGGLPFKATDRDLRAAFERFGRITDGTVLSPENSSMHFQRV